MGIDQRSMRLLPTLSIKMRAAQVMIKLVVATDRDVNVGLEKPRMVKMVAEKYIKEFCSSKHNITQRGWASYKTAELLQTLQ